MDEVELHDGYDKHAKMLIASGAVAGSAGAVTLLTGNPVGLAPLAVGGGHYIAARSRRDGSPVKEVETKAFLQDNLSVEEMDGEYRINFDYTD